MQDFSKCTDFSPVFRKSKDGVTSNILILLHGFGDTALNFIGFASKMNLPQTCILALEAPLPAIEGIDDIRGWLPTYDSLGNEIKNTDACVRLGSTKITAQLTQFIIKHVLISPRNEGGWPKERVFILGFAQGATVALDFSLVYGEKLGGIVAICGWPLVHFYPGNDLFKLTPTQKTPTLITYGLKDSTTEHESQVLRVLNLDSFYEIVRVQRFATDCCG